MKRVCEKCECVFVCGVVRWGLGEFAKSNERIAGRYTMNVYFLLQFHAHRSIIYASLDVCAY